MTPQEMLDLGAAAAVILTAVNLGVWLIKFFASRLDRAREDAIMRRFDDLHKDIDAVGAEVSAINTNLSTLIGMVTFVVDHVIKRRDNGNGESK